MKQTSKHIHRYHHHSGFSYPASFAQKFYSIFLGPLFVVGLLYVLARFFSNSYSHGLISVNTLLLALLATVSRLTVAYVISVVVAIPLALFITSNTILETIFLPIFDILESIPILAFFPVIILIFLRFNFLNGAAIFIIFLGMVWNLLFTLVGGLKLIPRDIIDASNIFHLHGEAYFWKVILPSIVPQLVTGSILAVAQGWNIIIVAEVMHVYLPGGTNASDLFGIGTILVHASGSGQMTIFIMAIITMVLTIACFNFFIWQKLLHYAQRYRFE